MSVSGIRSSGEFELPAAEPAPAAPAAEPAPEVQVVRGGSGERPAIPTASTVVDVVHDLSANELQKKLEATGLDRSDAKAEAKAIKKDVAEIESLEKQLAQLKRVEKALIAERDDPSIDGWERSWVEWDLADVRWEIGKLEEKLGKLEGKLSDLVGKIRGYWAAAFSSLESLLGLRSFMSENASQALNRALEQGQRERAADAAKRARDAEERARAERTHRDLADKGLIRPAPPDSPAVRRELEKLFADLRDRRFEVNKDGVEQIRTRATQARAAAD